MKSTYLFRAARLPRPLFRNLTPGTRAQQRLTSSSAGPQQRSAMAEFYKDFSRPVAKVLSMAMFAYQVAYWGWVRLESHEFFKEREGEIQRLEAEIWKLSQNQEQTTSA